ncbi:TPA: M48 family metalloprotease [Candidatus Micrarchaeota archaeon]|nr:M48 family metalloprotease [Candidatus Micrarchaeota archaeon]
MVLEDFMLSHLLDVVGGFFSNPSNLILSFLSIAVSLTLLHKFSDKNISRKQRIALVYGHLAFLFAPLVFLALSISCPVASLGCSVTLTQTFLYGIPVLLLMTVLAGFVFLPRYYQRTSIQFPGPVREFVKKESKRLKLSKTPGVFSVDSGKPDAFSISFFKPRIFVSVGMQEILGKKELEAVLLHELAHIKNASTWFKFSSAILKVFSPFAAIRNFGFSVEAEEKKADDYAARIQGTRRHLNSAKRKVSFNC